jgi:Tfp pilus assembly protein PilW
MRSLKHDRDDSGVTLIEMLVTLSLTLVVGTVMLSGVISSHKLFRFTQDEQTGQTDVRVTIERLGRDVRDARSLDAGATESALVLWIDSNSDYKKQATEVVTWQLVANANGHYDVTRTVNGSMSRTAKFVISQLAFCYKTDPASSGCLTTPLTQAQADKVLVVSSDIEYDANTNGGAKKRHASFSERLRNVST